MRDLPDNVPAFPLPGVEEFKHLMPAAAMYVSILCQLLPPHRLWIVCSSLPKVTTTSQDDEDEDELVGGKEVMTWHRGMLAPGLLSRRERET